MGKFITGVFVGAVAMLFLIANGQLHEEEEAARRSKSEADAALKNAQTNP